MLEEMVAGGGLEGWRAMVVVVAAAAIYTGWRAAVAGQKESSLAAPS